MIVEKSDNEAKGQFSPRKLEQNHQAAPDWQKVSAPKWQQTLMALSDSAIEGKDRLYWMLTFRDWIAVNLNQNGCENELLLTELAANEPSHNEQHLICLSLMNQLAYRLCDWPLMIDIFKYLSVFRPTEKPSDFTEQVMVEVLHCAVAYWQLGQLETSLKFLSDYMPHFDETSALHQFYQQVSRDIDANHFSLSCKDNDELFICPLEEQHLSSFTWVYQDTQIAKLCNLPVFGDDEQWYQWLDNDQVNANKHVFAVNHLHWGFIGVVSIEVHDGVGFFYYWLGQDFQGGGLGPQAVNLLLEIAQQHMDMRCCYAKVFKDNIASQKAMGKMGFNPVPFGIDKPNDDQMYFYRGGVKQLEPWLQELVDLAAITDMDSKILP